MAGKFMQILTQMRGFPADYELEPSGMRSA